MGNMTSGAEDKVPFGQVACRGESRVFLGCVSPAQSNGTGVFISRGEGVGRGGSRGGSRGGRVVVGSRLGARSADSK